MQLTLHLPPRHEQLALNRRRWAELQTDPTLAALPNRIETNGHGQIVMNPPPSGRHSTLQGEIVFRLRTMLGGRALPECPVSTVDGVKAADVGWYSDARYEKVAHQLAYEIAPEICVEVSSPSNTGSELKHKKFLYFEAGAEEVWICHPDGTVEFSTSEHPSKSQPRSPRCPDFPTKIEG